MEANSEGSQSVVAADDKNPATEEAAAAADASTASGDGVVPAAASIAAGDSIAAAASINVLETYLQNFNEELSSTTTSHEILKASSEALGRSQEQQSADTALVG